MRNRQNQNTLTEKALMSKTLRFIIPTVVLMIGLLFSACLFSNDNNGSTSTFVLKSSVNYTANDSLLIYAHKDSIYKSFYCDAGGLVTTYDTAKASKDTIQYSVSGNVFTIYSVNVFQDSVHAMFKVKRNFNYARQGLGNGLIGSWRPASSNYEVIGGTLSPSQKKELDRSVHEDSMDIAPNSYLITITSTTLEFYVDSNRSSFADNFIDDWNNAGNSGLLNTDSARYDISLVKVNNSTVKLTGNKSHEVVTISGNIDGDRTFTSNNTAHTIHVHYDIPKSCPNDDVPDWYTSFLLANAKITIFEKLSAQSISSTKQFRKPWGF